MRTLSALAVAVGVLVAVTACTGSIDRDAGAAESSDDPCRTPIVSGDASNMVAAPGSLGAAPEVTFPQPLMTTSIQRSVIIDGTGGPVQNGQPVILEATILNGVEGSILNKTAYAPGGASMFTVGDTALPALGKALACAKLGSRIAIVAPARDSVPAGSGDPGGMVVYVVDVLRAFQSRADGADQLPEVGMPRIVTAPDGTPGMTIPSRTAPTEYRSSVLKLGTGKAIAKGDVVVAKYTAVDWNTRKVTKSTWTTGSADILNLGAQTISEGLRKTLDGQPVGSQVLAVIPPALAGAPGSPPPSSTLVYVVDILGTVN